MRVVDHTVTPGGLTILFLQAAGPAAFATYEGVHLSRRLTPPHVA